MQAWRYEPNNLKVGQWIEKMGRALPAELFLGSGFFRRSRRFYPGAVDKGVLINSNQGKKWPGCYYHRSNP